MAAKKGNNRRTLTSRLAGWRLWVQACFALVWVNPFLRMHTMCSPVFHCYSCPWATFACPIGVIANFSAMHTFPFIAFGIIFMFGAFFGGFVCGWICPFGFLQDLIAKIPTPKFTLPQWTGFFRYVVLVGLVLVVPYWLGEGSEWFFCRLCPAGALEGAVPNVVNAWSSGAEVIPWPSIIKSIILGSFLIAMFFIRRPWCTLFCPLGAMYGLFNRFSFFLLRFHEKKCVDCDDCRSMCQYGGRADTRIETASCNRCLVCENCRAVTLGTALDKIDS